MIFIFKKKKIHLDCFTKWGIVAQDNPIQKTSRFVPEWWKSLPNYITKKSTTNNLRIATKNGTMKNCPGFVNLFSHGVVLPLWSDLNILVEEDRYQYQFAIGEGLIETHSTAQYGEAFPDQIHFKIVSPWFFKENTKTKFFWCGFSWESIQKYPKIQIVHAVVDFNLQHTTNINGFFIKDKEPYQYDLLAGTPLVHIVPISDKIIEPHIHVVDNVEWDSLRRQRTPYKFFAWQPTRIKKHKNNI